MREQLERITGDYQFYHARREAYATADALPFRISPSTLEIVPEQAAEIKQIGQDIVDYMHVSDELYRENNTVRKLLSRGKPPFFQEDVETDYLFFRPDLIITEKGFTACEIETSPFGLGLAELLNRGYRQTGFETMVGDTALPDYVSATTPVKGTIAYSSKTKAYSGQLAFLAEAVFSQGARDWSAQPATELESHGAIYRAFYLSEYLSDPHIHRALGKLASSESLPTLPSLTPHMEEKAIMSLIWDKRFENHYLSRLGEAAVGHLRQVIPPNWIVGEEEHFAPGLPYGMQTSLDIADLPKSKRQFVLKVSGFSDNSSWAEGVNLLHQMSAESAKVALVRAAQDHSHLHVIQEFRRGIKLPMQYETDEGIATMQARVRVTPYFSAVDASLVAIKATGCENTDRLHATSASINTAVSVKLGIS